MSEVLPEVNLLLWQDNREASYARHRGYWRVGEENVGACGTEHCPSNDRRFLLDPKRTRIQGRPIEILTNDQSKVTEHQLLSPSVSNSHERVTFAQFMTSLFDQVLVPLANFVQSVDGSVNHSPTL
eukprot:TRINITY_DN22562_c0_g1_i1.p1 TRINITY_DN22562_c0_g1~~TRINITY_DN22562_c0_g1_i1.p1  ORF type:complete len:126 (+),score=20.65 TRINITY_DN22562_c0_g1_i1:80-457(+)